MDDFNVWDLQLVFQMVRNLHSENIVFIVRMKTEWSSFTKFHKDLHLRSYLTFEMAWRSSLLCQDEWWPACREHESFLMLPGAQRLECMKVSLTCANLCHDQDLPAWSSGLPTAEQVSNAGLKENIIIYWPLKDTLYFEILYPNSSTKYLWCVFWKNTKP